MESRNFKPKLWGFLLTTKGLASARFEPAFLDRLKVEDFITDGFYFILTTKPTECRHKVPEKCTNDTHVGILSRLVCVRTYGLVFVILKNINENENKNHPDSSGRKHIYSLLQMNGWQSEVKKKKLLQRCNFNSFSVNRWNHQWHCTNILLNEYVFM